MGRPRWISHATIWYTCTVFYVFIVCRRMMEKQERMQTPQQTWKSMKQPRTERKENNTSVHVRLYTIECQVSKDKIYLSTKLKLKLFEGPAMIDSSNDE